VARRLQQQGIYVSTQPGFVYYSGDRYLEQVPVDQLPWLYPLRTLEEAGVPVAASSDSPVVPANPFAGLYAAATRRSEGHQAVGLHQAVAVERALRMYTRGSAATVFQEGMLGRIAPGALADMTLLPENPTAVPPEMLLELSVQLTIVDGQVAWEAP
jgi:predicted amidohydrolase YtcJ